MIKKYYFLSSPEVRQFIEYLKSGFYGSAIDLQRLLDEYNWPDNSKGLNFEKTYQKVKELRSRLSESLNYKDENLTFELCSEILNWGGVGVATKNIQELEKLRKQGSFMNILREARTMIRSSIVDTTDFSIPMNSGFSKIYSLLDEQFIIYDSRVAAKLCWLVKDCFGINPASINLGKCDYQAKVNRNPGPEFPMLTGYPKRYFESNLKAAWILEKLALESTLPGFSLDKLIFAFQTALFVAGKELPEKTK